MSRERPCSRRVCGGAGPPFLECQRGPRFTFLCCQKGKAQVFQPQLLARTQRQLGFPVPATAGQTTVTTSLVARACQPGQGFSL